MRIKRVLYLSIFILLIVGLVPLILQLYFPLSTQKSPLLNRFLIRSIIVDWVQLDSIDERGRGIVNAAKSPLEHNTVYGIRLKMILEFVSDSTKFKSMLLSLPGRDGAMDPIQSISWENAMPNQPVMPIRVDEYRLLDIASIEDHSDQDSSTVSRNPLRPIPNLDSIASWLNTGCCFPNSLDGRIAFYLWLDSSNVSLLNGLTPRLNMSLKSGQTIAAPLSNFIQLED